MDWSVQEILEELIQLGENIQIEAKQASEIGSSVMQTICAFTNEPGLGGGWLLLGVCEPDDEHDSFWIKGISNPDKLLGDLQNNCRNQFEHPVTISCKREEIEGKLIIAVFVNELEPSAKPCRFIGKFDKHNKKKTGVWRRGANGDYECIERELEPILIARTGLSYEQTVFHDTHFDDLEQSAIDLYRRLRAQIKPSAEELQVDDVNMLYSLHLIKKEKNNYLPNLAGLLLLGKSLSLRRLLPAVRVDYVRLQGTEWVENPEQRFSTTLDLREPLLRLITKLESAILDDMPHHFRLEEGQIQRSDQPLLPQKVIREAIVNSVMHRDYHVNQPILVARYSNRLEIKNPGYSLKPVSEMNDMGSKLRNPIIANVLYELGFAENKGSGVRTMQRLLENAGLTKPVFFSNREGNEFTATFLLHQLLNEEQLKWLQQFKQFNLSDDEAKALVLIKEIGAIDNAALRAITGLDTLAVSQILRRLWQQYHLIDKEGNGRATYYRPSELLESTLRRSILNRSDSISNVGDLPSNRSDLPSNRSDLPSNRSDLSSNRSDLPRLLQQSIDALSSKPRKFQLWPILLNLCLHCPHSAEEIGKILNRDVTSLKTHHLTELRKQGLIDYTHPEVINHPEQGYQITNKGKRWLKEKKEI
ncbi:MAG: putative DNA binding domain-containing protein [Gammaproteobacteria bacterium]|nr:putative DNA binding domain-containing protein [Gammaproteobacteria bacterium]